MKSHLWVEEKHEDFLQMRYKAQNVLFSGKSDFQHVDIVETQYYGRMLLNDGLVMVTEKDEFVYHEMIAHVPLFVHPNPKKVLVIGGGDGGTVREVCRHSSVEECVVVEIDGMVVESCRKFIPMCARGFDHPKARLVIEDGIEFIKKAVSKSEKFDVILVDSTDPIGPATPLFGEEFYHNLKRCLNEDGIVVSQAESPWYELEMQKSLLGILNRNFPIVSLYNFSNLTYPGGLWSFSFASLKRNPLKDFDLERAKSCNLKFKYYNEQIHQSAFALPQFVLENIGRYFKDET